MPAQPSLDHLCAFCGGLETAFANTTSVESDFAILKFEKDDFRVSLMALSLEGVFHTKKLAMMCELLGRIRPEVAQPEQGQQDDN